MASLQKRNKTYYIVFSKREGEDFVQRKFSLNTKDKRKASKLKIEFEELFEFSVNLSGTYKSMGKNWLELCYLT